MDDTLVVEVASAGAAFLTACELAREKYGVDPDALHQTIRQTARKIWYAAPTHPYCKSIGISSWEGLWARYEGPGPDLKALRKFAPTYRHQSWLDALKEFDIDDPAFADALAETFQTERRKLSVIYPDVEPVLTELAEKYRLALISNGAPDLQQYKLDSSGLEHYFETVVISGVVGIRKPEPGIFHILLDKLQLKADETIVIGNGRNTDILGAQRANIKAIWLNRDNSDYDSDIVPEYQIKNLTQLPKLLNSFQ